MADEIFTWLFGNHMLTGMNMKNSKHLGNNWQNIRMIMSTPWGNIWNAWTNIKILLLTVQGMEAQKSPEKFTQTLTPWFLTTNSPFHQLTLRKTPKNQEDNPPNFSDRDRSNFCMSCFCTDRYSLRRCTPAIFRWKPQHPRERSAISTAVHIEDAVPGRTAGRMQWVCFKTIVGLQTCKI